MKGMCYIILIVAFLMFYQREPIFSLVIIGIAISLYLFYKRRSYSSRGRSGGFFSAITGRGNDHQERAIDDMITLMMLQQLFSDGSSQSNPQNANQFKPKENPREKELQRIKDDILSLFNEE